MAKPFVFACITPHGLPIIEEVSGQDKELMRKTRSSMVQLGNWMREAKPDTIVVLTPHGLRIDSQFSVANSSYMYGEISEKTVAMMTGGTREDEGVVVRMNKQVDRVLSSQVIENAKELSLPVASPNFATSEGIFSCLPLDWGAMVPLYFMPDVPIVVVTPTRSLSFGDHIQFGEAMRAAVQKSGKRVGLIASCDWSHTHSINGPYGYSPDASKLDDKAISLLKNNHIEAIASFDDTSVEQAKPDGIWQSLILAGAILPMNRKNTFLSYEVPTYFGMMCIAYH